MFRPKIDTSKSRFDKYIEIFSLLFWVATILLTLFSYANLPDTIPTQFDLNGTPNEYGSKITVWLSPAISSVLVVGLFFLNNYPHQFNYLVKITPENAKHQYELAQSMVRKLNLAISIIFLLVSKMTIDSAHGNSSDFDVLFIGYIGVAPLVILIHYVFKSSQKNTNSNKN